MSEPAETSDNARSLHDGEIHYSHVHQVMKNFALEVCQLLFAENNHRLVWNADPAQTKISIQDKYTFNLPSVGTTPAIVANRGPLAWMRSSGFRQMQSENLRTGSRTYTDLVRGAVTLSCFARSGLEAEEIAAFVWESFQYFRDVLRKIGNRGRIVPHHLGFFRIEATTMGEEALVKANSRPEFSVVPVAIAASVQRRWLIEPRNARKLLNLTVRARNNGNP